MAASTSSVDQSKTNPTDVNDSSEQKKELINKTIRKDVDKIVDKYDIEDVATQCNAASNKTVSYCRCWKSKKFPLCDGSHNTWNKETGDNVGPLVITNKQ